MRRREALAGLSALALSRPGRLLAGAPQKFIVIGAGLAGLAAALELRAAGHEVTVLEARSRPGGRVCTLREPFADGQHAEAGAVFIPQRHSLTLGYAKRFGLELEPALPLFEARLYFVRGKHVVANASEAEWPFELRAEERKLGRAGLWKRYLSAALDRLGEKAADLDRMSGEEFLRTQGASAGAIALLRVGFLDMMAEGIESYSALQMLERVALSGEAGRPLMVREGTERLPLAFARSLEGCIRYDAPVVRIEQAADSVSVIVGARGRTERLTAERLICTIPFPVLRRIEVSPAFSSDKRRAVDGLRYTSVTRVFLQFSKKLWTTQNLYVLASTDMPVKWVYEHTLNQSGPRGILEAQAVGADARALASMDEMGRREFVLSYVERLYPGARAHCEKSASYSWDDDPWARGAFPYFAPGELLALRPHLPRPEGRIHFAGEHTSSAPGWMQGALESGIRAAREVASA